MPKNIALETKNIVKYYKGGYQAVKGIDLTVYEGDFFALLGPNGAGKSTLLGMVSSLVRISSGDSYLFGNSITQYPREAKKLLGFMPQEVNLSIFETPLQILLTHAGYHGISRNRTLNQVNYLLRVMELYDERNYQVRFLSGGMKRRLMVARALVHKPKVLILDEPTAGVDVELRTAMWNKIKSLNDEGLTIILTTHYLEEAERLCNRLALINKGELYINTTMSDMFNNSSNETYIVDLKESYFNMDFLESLSTFKFSKVSDRSVCVDISGSESLNQLFNLFLSHSIEVVSIRKDFTKLERIFMKIASSNK